MLTQSVSSFLGTDFEHHSLVNRLQAIYIREASLDLFYGMESPPNRPIAWVGYCY